MEEEEEHSQLRIHDKLSLIVIDDSLIWRRIDWQNSNLSKTRVFMSNSDHFSGWHFYGMTRSSSSSSIVICIIHVILISHWPLIDNCVWLKLYNFVPFGCLKRKRKHFLSWVIPRGCYRDLRPGVGTWASPYICQWAGRDVAELYYLNWCKF